MNCSPGLFKGEYPCLWSEYQVDMPNFFKYVTLSQGYLPFKINTKDSRQVNFQVTDTGRGRTGTTTDNFDDNVVTHRWVMANIPGLKEEQYSYNCS